MAFGTGKTHINQAEYQKLKEALGYGMLNLGFAIEADAKDAFQDVGGPLPRPHSSPGDPPVVQTGNLRRSIHTVAYVDGAVLEHTPGVDIPDYGGEVGADEIGVIVGTNTGYGLFLEVGTSRMAARPYLTPAFNANMGKAEELIAAGAKRHYTPTP